jgi:hypothetical protein
MLGTERSGLGVRGSLAGKTTGPGWETFSRALSASASRPRPMVSVLLLLVAWPLSLITAFGQVQSVGAVKTVGGAVTLYGNSAQVPSDPRGIFVVNAMTHTSSSEWTPYILPLIGGCLSGNPCSAVGNAVKGAAHEVGWATIATVAPAGVAASCGTSCNGGSPGYSDSDTSTRVVDWDTCNGSSNCPTPPHKQSGLEIETTKYQDSGAGTFNPGVPTWYDARVNLSSIARTNQGSYGVINLGTGANNITFLVGVLVGNNPAGGCIPMAGASLWGGVASDGVTQCAQVLGASPSDLNGVYAICDGRTTGCSNPTQTSLSLYTSTTTAETGAASTGTVGNPMMDYDNSALGFANDVCTDSGLPMWWGQNFWNSYRAFLTHEFTTWGSDSRIGYLRPGFGHGYENGPADGNGPTGNCRTVLNSFGYPSTDPAGCAAGTGCSFWENYLNAQIQWVKANVASLTTKPIEIALNMTSYSHPDAAAPTIEANNIVAAGMTLDSNGLRQDMDLGYVYPGGGCDNNSCYNYDLHRGNISYNWQTVGMSDPTGTLNTTNCAGDSKCNQAWETGPLPPLLRFVAFHGAQRVELYSRDVECTIPGFNGNSFGVDSKIPNTYANCFKAGYAESIKTMGALLQ